MASPSVRIVQPGFDVRNCPDWAYLFNSDWPSLGIVFEKVIPSSVTLPYTINHNLGFPPLAIGWGFGLYGDTEKSYGRVSSAYFEVTATSITVLEMTGDGITLRLFNVDVSKEQSYQLPQSAQAKLPYNANFGIKQAKQGRYITSSNLNDFIIHSRAQSPAILQVATEKGQYYTNSNPGSQYAGPWIVYPYKTSYIPWLIGAYKVSSSPVTYQFVSLNGIQIINGNIVLPTNGNPGGSLIVLRDPLFYPNTVQVVY